MKTTLELPDDLMRTIKVRAAREDRKLKDLIADLLRRGLTAEAPASSRTRVQLPLVTCAHAATVQDEVTPARAAELLIEEEALASTSL